jgi:pimeloyl-ACP methyl ester carboxylesterase
MDTVGFGASARLAEPPTIEAYGRGAIALLDALAIPQVAIVGHHTGGVVAVEVATTVPDRVGCLVLSGTTCVDPVERAREVRPSVDEVPVAADGSHLLALWRKREPYYPPQRPDLLQRFVLDALKVFDRVEEGHQAVREYAIRERLPRVEAPTLLVCGTEDWNALPAQEMLARLIPNSRSRLVPGAGVPMVDHMPEVFAQIVTEYMEEIGYGTAYQ